MIQLLEALYASGVMLLACVASFLVVAYIILALR